MIPNFSRSLLKQLEDSDPELSAVIESAVKFSLPDGGRLLDTHSLSAIESLEELHLPYKTVSIEFIAIDGPEILIAEETSDHINVRSFAKYAEGWAELKRKISIEKSSAFNTEHGNFKFKVSESGGFKSELEEHVYAWHAWTVMHFMNTLACSNVEIENVGKSKSASKKTAQDSIPFDEYHILTIRSTSKASLDSNGNSSHRSPREHLRRGHIRRLEDGRRIWINATVINAGIGSRVTKRYQLKGK